MSDFASSLSTASVRPPLEIPKAQWRILSSLGLGIERFLHARRVLLNRVAKPGRMEEWKPYFQEAPDAAKLGLLEGVGTFAVALLPTASGLSLAKLLLDETSAAEVAARWHEMNPASKAPSAALAAASADEAAIWPALLRLKPLQSFWELEMRSNHFNTLLTVMPDAWVLDPAPIPPGAVIPRLEIPDWNQLEALASKGRSFALSGAWQTRTPTTLTEALQSYPDQVNVLMEVSPATSAGLIFALYEKTEKRTDLLGALLLNQSTIAKVISE